MACLSRVVKTTLIIWHCFAQEVSSFASMSSESAAAGRQYKMPVAHLHTHTQDAVESSGNNSSGPLETLCSISLRACDLMTPLITSIYEELILSPSNDGSDDIIKAVKKDNSAFTIADATVQRLLIKSLFSTVQFRDIVGEEEEDGDSDGCDSIEWWYQVQGLTVPQHLQPLLDSTRIQIETLAKDLSASNNNDVYQLLTIFIDPIDGTREFTNGKGEQCSICIGFADEHGKAVAGVVFRPLSKPSPTWVAGAKSEGFATCYFGEQAEISSSNGLLSTNGSISKFVQSLIDELKAPRIKSGGAGNKMMMLLQNPGYLYIQDRGVSRWDTCAAEACLEAFGGRLLKLTGFLDPEIGQEENECCYSYLASDTNLDFVPNTAFLTKYNSNLQDFAPGQKADDVRQVKPYSNLCGLVAFTKEGNMEFLQDAIRKAAAVNPPSLD